MRIEINGNTLNVEVLGKDANSPVMIVHHGGPGLSSMSEPKTSFGPFSDEYRVVVFDSRGCGLSEGKPPLTHKQWAADVDGLRQWIGAEKIVMAGGSYGGFIAMEYAIRYPNRLHALVLRGTAADNSWQALARQNAWASPRVKLDPDRFERICEGRVRDNEDLKECWRDILPLYDHEYDPSELEPRVEATPYRYETHNFVHTDNLKTYDIKAQLPGITCPTLVTVGRYDWIEPVSMSETIARLIPRAKLVVFEHSGHSPQIEEAPLFQKEVRAFLARALTQEEK